KGTGHSVSFSREDALKPFLSSNDAIWSIFEPALRKRLAELDAAATIAERVRATLLEGLPSGRVAMDDVAQRLALSKRTLQRRLEDEGTSYHEVVGATRERPGGRARESIVRHGSITSARGTRISRLNSRESPMRVGHRQ